LEEKHCLSKNDHALGLRGAGPNFHRHNLSAITDVEESQQLVVSLITACPSFEALIASEKPCRN
jgi:hypothetical protein